MNVFQITRTIRDVGYGYGLPVWLIEFGLGVSYTPETLLKKLAELGAHEKDWVVLRKGCGERGVGTFVDALSYIHCKSEVEAFGGDPTPGWFNKADRWTVFWRDQSQFNFGALRKGQDMLVASEESLVEMLAKLGTNDAVDKGCTTSKVTDDLLSKAFTYKLRVYQIRNEEGA